MFEVGETKPKVNREDGLVYGTAIFWAMHLLTAGFGLEFLEIHRCAATIGKSQEQWYDGCSRKRGIFVSVPLIHF